MVGCGFEVHGKDSERNNRLHLDEWGWIDATEIDSTQFCFQFSNDLAFDSVGGPGWTCRRRRKPAAVIETS